MVEVIEPAHVLIVQVTSIIALFAALAALYILGRALPRFTAGHIKQITSFKFAQVVIFSLAMIFMVIYHVWDIDQFQDLWHLTAGIALAFGAFVAIKIAIVSRTLAK